MANASDINGGTTKGPPFVRDDLRVSEIPDSFRPWKRPKLADIFDTSKAAKPPADAKAKHESKAIADEMKKEFFSGPLSSSSGKKRSASTSSSSAYFEFPNSSEPDTNANTHAPARRNSSSSNSTFKVVELLTSEANKKIKTDSSDFATLFDNPIDDEMIPFGSDRLGAVSAEPFDDFISIPALLDSMSQKRREAEEELSVEDYDDDDDENDDEYFSGSPPILISRQELLSYMERALNNNKPVNPSLPRIKISRQIMREVKMYLWMNGPGAFIRKYVNPLSETPYGHVLAALNFPLPESLVTRGQSELLVFLIQKALQFTIMPRKRLPMDVTIDKLVEEIEKAKNIIVLTGAGISTSLGIPDFRSSSGLYTKLAALGLSEPQEVFDLSIFQQDPSVFYSIAREILPVTKKFSPTHLFIKMLQDRGKLLRNYTQNIDNLEHYAGIIPEKLVQCHGSFATATCQTCGYKTKGENLFDDIRNQAVSRCPVCKEEARVASTSKAFQQLMTNGKKKAKSKPKNPWGDDTDDDDVEDTNGIIGLTANGLNLHKKLYCILDPGNNSSVKYDPAPSLGPKWKRENGPVTPAQVRNPHFGIMKPDITFFGESLPNTFEETLIGSDDEKCDLLICIGTSLKVSPVSETVRIVPRNVVQVYISKTMVTHNEFDVTFLGASDDVVEHLCHKLHWKMNHPMAKNKDFAPYIKYMPDMSLYEFQDEPVKSTAPPSGASTPSHQESSSGKSSRANSVLSSDERDATAEASTLSSLTAATTTTNTTSQRPKRSSKQSFLDSFLSAPGSP